MRDRITSYKTFMGRWADLGDKLTTEFYGPQLAVLLSLVQAYLWDRNSWVVIGLSRELIVTFEDIVKLCVCILRKKKYSIAF